MSVLVRPGHRVAGRWRAIGAAWGCLLATAAGCRDVVSSDPPSPAPFASPRPASSDAPVFLGSASIHIPPDNSRANIEPWRPSGVAVPESSWVYIRISGSVTYRGNPKCDELPPYWSCGYPLDGQSFGPWERMGQVEAGIVGGNSPSRAPARPPGISWFGSGDTREVLFWAPHGGELYTYRWMEYTGAWHPNVNLDVPSYFLSGQQTISVEKVVPLRIVVPDRVAPGDSLRAEAQPDARFRFAGPNWRVPAPIWWAYELLDPSGSAVGGYELGTCYARVSCTHVPQGPGRLIVTTYVQNNLVTTKSEIVQIEACSSFSVASSSGLRLSAACEPPPQIVLECKSGERLNVVTRGESIRCEARKEPGDAPGELVVTGWSFNGKAREDGDQTSLIWEGPMAVGGTVTVRGTIGGVALTAEAPVTVEARDWSDKRPTVTAREVGNDEPRMSDQQLPDPPRWAHDLGFASFFAKQFDPLVYIESGPNYGYYYFADLPFEAEALYVLNRRALASNSEFARLQVSGGGQVVGKNYCDRSSVPGQLPRIEAHELKHVEVYRDHVARILSERLAEFEPMASESGADLYDAYDALRTNLDETATAESKRVVDDPNGPHVVSFADSQGRCTMKNADGGDLTNEPR